MIKIFASEIPKMRLRSPSAPQDTQLDEGQVGEEKEDKRKKEKGKEGKGKEEKGKKGKGRERKRKEGRGEEEKGREGKEPPNKKSGYGLCIFRGVCPSPQYKESVYAFYKLVMLVVVNVRVVQCQNDLNLIRNTRLFDVVANANDTTISTATTASPSVMTTPGKCVIIWR